MAMRHTAQQLLSIIDTLYEGMLDDDAWQAALIRMTDMVSGSAVALFSMNPSTGEVFRADTARIDAQVMRSYQNDWIQRDPRHAAALHCEVGKPQVDGMLIETRKFHRTPIFNEFFGPEGIPYHVATWLERKARRGVVLSIQGTWARGAFSAEDSERLKVLIPHVRRVVAMKDRLACDQIHGSALLQAMDRLPYGVLLLDATLRILEASTLARELLSRRSGLHADGGLLGFNDPRDMRAFAERLDEKPGKAQLEHLLIARRGDAPPLSLLVVPLAPSQQMWMGASGRWLVLLFDPEAPQPAADATLQQTFNLSRAESALARRIAMGMTVTEAAAQLGISMNTARTQLKSMFAKLGVRNQAQLVRKILGSSAPFVRRQPIT